MSTGDDIEQKTRELAGQVQSALTTRGEAVDDKIALSIVAHLAVVTPPPSPPLVRDMVTLTEGGRGGAQSVKPGNIVLNMRKLVMAVSSGVLTLVGAVQMPWTAIFGALVLWDTLYSGVTVELTEREASVIWTLWLRRDTDQTVPEAGLLAAVNDERRKYGRSDLSDRELEDALRALVRIRSIERSSRDPSRWWLREWVRVTYR